MIFMNAKRYGILQSSGLPNLGAILSDQQCVHHHHEPYQDLHLPTCTAARSNMKRHARFVIAEVLQQLFPAGINCYTRLVCILHGQLFVAHLFRHLSSFDMFHIEHKYNAIILLVDLLQEDRNNI